MKRLLFLLAITICWCGNDAFGQTRKKKVESDGFVWYEIYKGDADNFTNSAEDENGKILIPSGHYRILYHGGGEKYFIVTEPETNFEALYGVDGKCILPLNRRYKSVGMEDFGGAGKYCYYKTDNGAGICDKNGNEIIFLEGYKYLFPRYMNGKFFYAIVKKEPKNHGIADGNGRIIIEPKYKEGVYPEKGNFMNEDTGQKRVVGSLSSIKTTRPLQASNYAPTSPPRNNSSYASSSSTSSSSDNSSTSSSSGNSSSSSLASSTSSQTSSSSSSTQPKWNHQGWYLDMYDDRGFVQKQQITFYDDRMEIRNENSIKKGTCYTIPYYGMQNGWKLYRKEENYGPPLDKVVEDYYVNSSYDVKHLSTGTHFSTVERPMVKDGENINSYVRMTNSPSGGFSGGTSAGYSSGGSSGTGSSSNIPRPKCPNCVNGRKVYESTVPYSGTQIRYSTCSECGLRYQSSHRTHRHEQCTTCHGKGYLD